MQNDFLILLQLLAFTIQHEKPELEKRNTELLQKEEQMKMQLEKLEQSLLEVEKHVKADILLYKQNAAIGKLKG